ncbi:hypothetical protein Ddye_026577 [Dipteronia dyeriana]|uniref:RNase H type-1 domain-containing protein n=1 Tax=Dipteronia dyeriana TaxID=168575 RepID=A0AAD9TME7_9ROSI|nr:hypothetical protein Ddye_026577 [Dipteronia dyeriana]
MVFLSPNNVHDQIVWELSRSDSSLMDKLGVKPHLRKASFITSCVWCPPSYPLIKANTHGCSKGNPWDGACQGVFRNGNSSFIGGLSHNLGVCTSFVAEMQAALHVICIAYDRGWRWLWLETDSMDVISCFSNPNYSPLWQLHNFWLHSKYLINQMHFVIMHTFRERHMVADILANEGLKFLVMIGGITRLFVLLSNSTLILGVFLLSVFINSRTLLFSIIPF